MLGLLSLQIGCLGAGCINLCASGSDICAPDGICRITCNKQDECSEKLGLPSRLVGCISQACYQACSYQGTCIYPAGQKCTNGHCSMGCTNNQGCGKDQRCITSGSAEGVCGWSCKGSCAGRTSCGIDGICRQTCASDTDCPTGSVCRDESCFRTCTESKECLSEGRLHCWNGVCRQKCAQATDCPSGYMCSLAGDCEKVCHFNADCSVITGEACINGHCKDGCKDDADCSSSQTCNISTSSSTGTCVWKCSTDCSADQVCGADGICRNQCSKCQDKEECLYGSCFKKCNSDIDCTGTPNLSCIGFHCMAVCVSNVDCTGGRLCSFEGTCNYQCKGVACPHPSLCALDGVCRFKTETCQDGYTKGLDDGFCYLTCDSKNSDSPCDPMRTGTNNKPLDPSVFESNANYNPQQLAAQATSPLNQISMTCAGGNLCKAGCIIDSDCPLLSVCDQETHRCVRRADAPVLAEIKGCWHEDISLQASYGNLSFTLNVRPRNTAECRAAFSTMAIVRLNLSDYEDTIVQTLSDFSFSNTNMIRLACNPSSLQSCKLAMITSTSASVSIESATHIMSTIISDTVLDKYDYNTCFVPMQSAINLIKLLDGSPTQLCVFIAWNRSCPYLYSNKLIASTLVVHSDNGSVSQDDKYHLPPEIMLPSKEVYCTVIDESDENIANKVTTYFNEIWLSGILFLDLLIDEVQTEIQIELSGLTTTFMKACMQSVGVIISPVSIFSIVKGHESANGESCVIPEAIQRIVLTTVVKDYDINEFIVSERILSSFSYASTTSLVSICGTGYRRTTPSKDCYNFFSSISSTNLSTLDGYMRIALYDTIDSMSTNPVIRSIFYYTTYNLGCYNGTVVIVEPTVLSLRLQESGAKDCSIPTLEQAAIWQGVDLVNVSSTRLNEAGALVYTITAEIYTNSSMLLSMGKLAKQGTFSRDTDVLRFSCETDWVPGFGTEYAGMSCQRVLAELWNKKETALVGLTIDGVTNTSIHSGFIPSITIQSQDYNTTYIITFSVAAAFAVALNAMAIVLWVRLNKDVKALNLKIKNRHYQRNQHNQGVNSIVLGSN
ncbi:Tenascin-like protein [Giardia duodenalis]|uniref:Tenascin-like protein n=1 Tax=Giardia intestinalis (strain ATCC 50803 / WB clone C6) TaxID=184922 RepID=A8BWU4_GIAIC|nr:Tenascin-like protein [Giardia intestinalis]KAE8301222.1 Tenascin-like protein [Giardia intestinalis]|eukprot:XP_001704397.1 Tenascin-X precursor [Giardia lamblia ATCC 50803]